MNKRGLFVRLASSLTARGLPKMMIAGTFRSGTNLAQYCLSQYFFVNPVFNEWFWKHGVPPTNPKEPIPPYVPILVMSKNPVSLNASLYRFWMARRPELNIGTSLSDFIRLRFIVYDNSNRSVSPKYYYATPTEYWNQFYFSWLNWREVESRVSFLRCEDLVAAPELSLVPVASRFGFKRRLSGPIELPEHRVGPTPSEEIRQRDDRLSAADIEFILSQVDQDVATSLGYQL